MNAPAITQADIAAIGLVEKYRHDAIKVLSLMWTSRDLTAGLSECVAGPQTLIDLEVVKEAGMLDCRFSGGRMAFDLELTALGRLLVRRYRHFERIAETGRPAL
ncbi:MAG: hypothetical protein KDJ90_06695 [Nitratireductor sp.]|nr:hypothetical protein [Nitratireductor sp.]